MLNITLRNRCVLLFSAVKVISQACSIHHKAFLYLVFLKTNTMRLLLCCLLLSSFAVAQSFSPADIQRWEAQAKKITIIKDKWGIPHIYGKTDADAVFGLLYAQCEENFSRVERNYLEVLGRQAEADGERMLYTDLQMRLIVDSAAAIKDYNNSPVWFQQLLNAFADGINYYLYKHPETKPKVLTRFEPWFHLMFTDGSVSATRTGGIALEEVRSFYSGNKNATAFRPAVNKDVELSGSNGFAIAPKLTANGNAILYINPHVPFYFRPEMHMVSEEGLNAYGAVTWGQMFVYQGFNEHCGWMHTTGYADVADLYEEKVRQVSDTWVYEYEKEIKKVNTKPITVSYLKDGKQVPVSFTGYYTHHGPVMGNRNGKWLALKEFNRSLSALIQSWVSTKANNLNEFTEAMRLLSNTTNNTVYADDKGNIAYWHGDFVPKRNPAYDYTRPVDGSIKATEWQGAHKLEEIVQVHNPSVGWIQNCNSTPFTASGKDSPDKNKFPSYMAPDGQNARGINAARLLEKANNLTLDKVIALGYNRYLAAFDFLVPALLRDYDSYNGPLKNELKEAVDLIRNWDRTSSLSSVATTVALDWANQLGQYIPRAETMEEGTNSVKRFENMAATTPTQKMESLKKVLDELTKTYGNWRQPWGDINRYQRVAEGQRFDDSKPSIAVPLASSRWGSLPAFESRSGNGYNKRYGYSGNSFLAVVEFGKKLKAKTILTGGQSTDPNSPNFTDQAEGYVNGRFKEIFFYKEDVEKHKVRTYHPGER